MLVLLTALYKIWCFIHAIILIISVINNVLGVVRFYEDGQKYGKVASSNRQVYQAQTIDQEKEHTYHWRDYLSHLYSFIS